jgi:hypothetical protein
MLWYLPIGSHALFAIRPASWDHGQDLATDRDREGHRCGTFSGLFAIVLLLPKIDSAQ